MTAQPHRAEAKADETVAGVDAPGPAAPSPFDVDSCPGGARAALEAVLMVVDEPVRAADLAAALGVPEPQVRALLAQLGQEYDLALRGFTLRVTDQGAQLCSRHELAPVVERFLRDGRQARLTQAALETLAVIAYRQPVSRARVGAVRGVNVDGVVRTLVSRGLIDEVGVDPEHGAALYGTTGYFLQRLGLASLDELPPLAPHLPEVDMLADLSEGGSW